MHNRLNNVSIFLKLLIFHSKFVQELSFAKKVETSLRILMSKYFRVSYLLISKFCFYSNVIKNAVEFICSVYKLHKKKNLLFNSFHCL